MSGSCYQSSQEANTKHDLWSISVITLLDQSFPLNPESETQKQDKYTELKQLDKDYTKNIKGFIESQEQVYKAWLDTKKTIFKICDSPIEQIGANCQESGKSIDNYKKLLIKENNQDLFTNLDKINDFCNQAPDLVKNDNDTKFNELNNAFGQAFGKIVSIYPNIGDKTKAIKEIQVKIKTLLTDLSK